MSVDAQCVFCGLPTVVWADAIAHFGGGMGTPLCEWCESINEQLWSWNHPAIAPVRDLDELRLRLCGVTS